MARHEIQLNDDSGRPVKVSAGWDDPLQGFFLDIVRLDEPEMLQLGCEDDPSIENDAHVLYDNLRDPFLLNTPGAHHPHFDYFIAKATEHGVTLPYHFIRRVRANAPAANQKG